MVRIGASPDGVKEREDVLKDVERVEVDGAVNGMMERGSL